MTTKKKKPLFRLFDFQVDNTTYDVWNDEQGEDNKKTGLAKTNSFFVVAYCHVPELAAQSAQRCPNIVMTRLDQVGLVARVDPQAL